MNEMFILALRAVVIGFADDTSLLYSAATADEILDQFNHDMDLLWPWFRKNYLHLHTDKCKGMIYGYKTPRWADSLELKLGTRVLENVEEYKYLGLLLNSKLSGKSHSINVLTKLRKINYLFYHLGKCFSEIHLKKLYVLLYESVFNYGIIHWGACKHIKPIKVLQNRVCRTILRHDSQTTEQAIYTDMEMARLEELYKIKLAVFVFKNKNLFQLHNTGLQTRAEASVVAAHMGWQKEHSRIQTRYQGCCVFNELPMEYRQETRLSTFKRLVKKFFVEHNLL